MNRIKSTDITLKEALTLKQLMCIYSLSLQYSGNIYFSNKRQLIDACHIPKLTSFFLTIGEQEQLTIIVEGPNVNKVITEIEEACFKAEEKSLQVQTV